MKHNESGVRKEMIAWLTPAIRVEAVETEETQKGFPDTVGVVVSKDVLAPALYIECKDCSELTCVQLKKRKIPFREGQYPFLWKLYMRNAVVLVCIRTSDCKFIFIPMWNINTVNYHPEGLLLFNSAYDLKEFILKDYLRHKEEHLERFKKQLQSIDNRLYAVE
jgi:hypothetical protein